VRWLKSRRRGLVPLRKRLIRETEIALVVGLKYPERYKRIPVIEVGKGCFDRGFAARFWQETLGLPPD